MLRFIVLSVVALAACAGLIAWNHPCNVRTCEKAAQLLASPVGITWLVLLLFAVAAFNWKRRRTGWLLSGLLVFHTAAGSLPVGQWLLGYLEADFPPTVPSEAENVDHLVVLGGGLATRGDGALALSQSGDRIGLAARLFHAGKCQEIVATGSDLPVGRAGVIRAERVGDVRPTDQAAETARLLVELGVPLDRISVLGGYNTHSEMAAIADYAARHPAESIGIVSSAWHLKRVTRLAHVFDLTFTPFPADHETGVDELYYFPIPISGGFRRCERAIKEYVAMTIGR